MTEITDIRKIPLWPVRQPRSPGPVRYAIDPTAFVLALIGAPLVVTALTFWAMFIPVAAVVVGGPVYLALATPVLLWDLPRNEPRFDRLAFLGFAAAMAFAGLAYLLATLAGSRDAGTFAGLYAVMGAIFAPLWAGTFAPLYRSFRRDRFAAPLA